MSLAPVDPLDFDQGNFLDTLTPPTSGSYPSDGSAVDTMRRAFKVVMASLFGLLVVAAIAMAVIEVPYFGLSPGEVRSTEDRVTIGDGSDLEQFPSDGEVYFTTVSLERLTVWGWLISRFRSDLEVVDEELILGSRSQDENRELNRRLMSTSQDDAVIVALSRLGMLGSLEVEVSDVRPDSAAAPLVAPGSVLASVDGSAVSSVEEVLDVLDAYAIGDTVEVQLVDVAGGEVVVELPVAGYTDDGRTPEVDPIEAGLGLVLSDREVFESSGARVFGLYSGMPAETVLELGDVVRSVDGEPIDTPGSLVEAIRGKEPGDVITLAIGRLDDEVTEVEVTLGARPDDPSTPLDESLDAFLGADVQQDVEVGVDIEFDADDVGGPSAGLAFTLAIVDLLSPGDLFAGRPVAVTGTIALDGTVGAIGGIDQKAHAVKDEDFELFIVPDANDLGSTLETAAGEYEVFPVTDIDDALTELIDRGGAADGVRILTHDQPV